MGVPSHHEQSYWWPGSGSLWCIERTGNPRSFAIWSSYANSESHIQLLHLGADTTMCICKNCPDGPRSWLFNDCYQIGKVAETYNYFYIISGFQSCHHFKGIHINQIWLKILTGFFSTNCNTKELTLNASPRSPFTPLSPFSPGRPWNK